MAYTALLAGATGLTGGHCLRLLLDDPEFETVKVLTRRPLGMEAHKLVEIVVDFDQLEDYRLQMEATHVFCALGTTIAKAGSKEAFKKVDYEYPLRLAKIARSLDCSSFSVITAMGSNTKSPFFYSRVKGDLELELEKLGFPSLQILQPSLLMGERSERRFGEGIAQVFFDATAPLWVGPLKKVAGISGGQVAKAMIHYAKLSQSGTNRYTSDILHNV